jgi:hypothetical protein
LRKLELKKDLKQFYSPSPKKVDLVRVPPMNFIMIDGKGDPNTSKAYRDSIDVLFSLSYTLKFAIKKEDGVDYPVMALEGLWSTPLGVPFTMAGKDTWSWTSMMMQPDCVSAEWFRRAVEMVKAKKELPALGLARLERFEEGLSAQTMHLGPYSAEEPTIKRIHAFILESGYVLRGRHHEIYLGDPRRSAPEKLRTIIRQPVGPKGHA